MKDGEIMREGEATYKGRRDRHSPPLVPRLHHRRINAFDGIGQGVKITRQKPMHGEIGMQDVKKVHQSCRYIFRHCQIAHKR